jgi:hypothetical protein
MGAEEDLRRAEDGVMEDVNCSVSLRIVKCSGQPLDQSLPPFCQTPFDEQVWPARFSERRDVKLHVFGNPFSSGEKRIGTISLNVPLFLGHILDCSDKMY